jgi:hypothetical protein
MTSMSLALAAALIAGGNARASCKADSYEQLREEFPDAVQYHRPKATIEFCPDNTCHRFTSLSNASCEAMSDFLLLYLRYFSDYGVLEKWRARPDTSRLVEKVLSKAPYAACTRGQPAARARCAAGKAITSYRIVGHNVTYDEGNATKTAIPLRNLKQKETP